MEVYGSALKALVHEKFGARIIGAINLKLDIKNVDASRRRLAHGDHVITLDGKHLPTKPFRRGASIDHLDNDASGRTRTFEPFGDFVLPTQPGPLLHAI